MKMKHPKTCYRCEALDRYRNSYVCLLGYDLSQECIGTIQGCHILRISPADGLCPKPMTHTEYLRAPHALF